MTTQQRRLVVISGPQTWAENTLLSACHQQVLGRTLSRTLLVSENTVGNSVLSKIEARTPASKVRGLLGSEVDTLIWDGFSGFNPDAFGAASGLLVGGGLLFLLLPEFEAWQASPDSDYLRMCSSADELKRCHTHFLERTARIILNDSSTLIVTPENFTLSSIASAIPSGTTAATDQTETASATFNRTTDDQKRALVAIEHVASGHRNRPLVITADRGRGKTSILGISAAQIINTTDLSIIITAPNKKSVAAAFEHFNRHHDTLDSNNKFIDNSRFRFIAPDELIATQPEASLVFVDEAAAIPAPVLKKILTRYSRLVFSSTIHGYEGTGQGFAVRFRRTLDQLSPQWKKIELKQAIRWASEDPVEKLIFQVLCLDADFEEELSPIPNIAHTDIRWLSSSELATHELLLKQVMGLLVLAHYQTSPSDLRLMLDHPDIRVVVSTHRNGVLSVALVMSEGKLNNPELAKGIVAGTRRPKGQLVPQALTSFSGDPTIMSLSCLRIMRIAVHPSAQQKGFGSALVAAVMAHARQQATDYVSVSFGMTSKLAAFWQKNSFVCTRMGYHKDSASGTNSVFYTQALSEHADTDLHRLQLSFLEHFVFGLTRYFSKIPWQHVDAILGEKQALVRNSGQNSEAPIVIMSAHHKTLLQLFALQSRSELDCAVQLEALILVAYDHGAMQHMEKEEKSLLIRRVLQQQTWSQFEKAFAITGRKDGDKKLRNAIAKLLTLCTTSGLTSAEDIQAIK